MSKVYILTDRDFDELILEISKDPRHGADGGSSVILSDAEQKAYLDAHAFYNYIVRRWASGARE